jgi:hypothetical protein
MFKHSICFLSRRHKHKTSTGGAVGIGIIAVAGGGMVTVTAVGGELIKSAACEAPHFLVYAARAPI